MPVSSVRKRTLRGVTIVRAYILYEPYPYEEKVTVSVLKNFQRQDEFREKLNDILRIILFMSTKLVSFSTIYHNRPTFVTFTTVHLIKTQKK